MRLEHSPSRLELTRALEVAADSGSYKEWVDALNSAHGAADGFLAIAEWGLDRAPFNNLPFGSLPAWLAVVHKWYWQMHDPSESQRDVGSILLFALWKDFSNTLIQSLRRGRMLAEVPQSGGLLAFVAGLEMCIVVRYQLVGETAMLRVVSVIDNPTSVFDFWGAIDHAEPNARNDLKMILGSGHKLIAHRGLLVHVDRRSDRQVFGPSIDTLLLAEILHQEYFEDGGKSCKTAIEIGSGSGFLTTAILQNCQELVSLDSVDTNFHATQCTYRNTMTAPASVSPKCDVRLTCGQFRSDDFRGPFDLVVCNPPYIPTPPGELRDNRGEVAEYYEAVGGIELLEELLDCAGEILAPDGRLLLMLSSVCQTPAIETRLRRYQVRYPLGRQGFEVAFDVEAVLARPEWLSFLEAAGGLVVSESLYYHSLHPVWVSRRA